MDSWQNRYLNRYYRSIPGWVDGTTEFHELIRHHAKSFISVLELGCGSTNNTSRFLKSHFKRVEGLDVDPRAATNAHLDQFHLYRGGIWPLSSDTYDAIVANYVFEHVSNPAGLAREAFRVLKPDGLLMFRTPNLLHYVSLIARLTPHWFHRLVSNQLRNMKAESVEPYETHHRLNTKRKIWKIFRNAGFREVELRMIEKEPSYGLSSRTLFLFFMFYERMMNRYSGLVDLRANILGVYRKEVR